MCFFCTRSEGIGRREWEKGKDFDASELASDMMKHAVRIVQSRILQQLRLGVQLDTYVNASVVVPATRWCSKRMYSEEAHASSTHLDRGNVVARVLNAVKTHQKVDPTKVWRNCSVPLPLLFSYGDVSPENEDRFRFPHSRVADEWLEISFCISFLPSDLGNHFSMLAMLHIWLGCFSDPHVNLWLEWCDNGENIWHCLICKKNHWNSGNPESLTWGCLLDPHIEFCSDSLTTEKTSLQYTICKKNRRTSGNLKSLARGCLLDPHIKLCSQTMEKTYCIVFYAKIALRFVQSRELGMGMLVRSSYQACSDGLTMWKTLLHCVIS